MKRLLIIFIYIFPSFGFTSTWVESIQQLVISSRASEDRQWLKLLHFEPGLFGRLESQIDGTNFFLSPVGNFDSEAELIANIKAFSTDPLKYEELKQKGLWNTDPVDAQARLRGEEVEGQLSQCRFPARYMWLKKKFSHQIKNWPDVACPRFQRFYSTLYGPSVSLVFSSFYLNNPSSAFGHSLLRVNKMPDSDGQRYELLDYGINYAANLDTDNALVYAFRGLFGLFKGSFTSVPYYFKVREYNNAESRDLWDFELKTSPETTQFLVAHIWELGPAQINYWYLTENCSYHMFTILEASDPKLDLVSKLKKYVIPSDTVQLVWNENLVKSFSYRPSVRTQLAHRALDLSESDKNLISDFVQRQKIPEDLASRSIDDQIKILDTAVDYMDFKFSHAVQLEDSEASKFKNQILSKRSQINKNSPQLKVPIPILEKVHEGHGSRRLDMAFVTSDRLQSETQLAYKFALHDYLDPIRGYPEYAKISFWDMRASYLHATNNLSLKELTLFEVVSLTPYKWSQEIHSFRVKFGLEQLRSENCDLCRYLNLSAGVGYTKTFGKLEDKIFYLGVRGQAGGKDGGDLKSYFTGGPNLIFRWRHDEYLMSVFEHWYKWNLQGTYRWDQESQIALQKTFSKAWGLRVNLTDWGFDRGAGLSVVNYH